MPLRRLALRSTRVTPSLLRAVLRQPASSPMRKTFVERYVRWGYDAINAGHEQAALSLLDPEIEVRDPPELPDADVYHGHAGVLENLEKFRTVWDYSYEIVKIVDAGDRIVVTFRAPVKGKLGGIELEDDWAHLWTVDDGRIVRLEWLTSAAEARARLQR